MERSMLIWIIIIILFICCVGVWLHYKQPNVVERFGVFNTAASKSMYSKAGIEPCTILDNQTLTSQMYLGSLRFRKEKPGEQGKSQCYYFTDRDPKKTILQGEIPDRNLPPVADPLSAYPCDKDVNPLFKDVNFITGAKEVSTPDATLQPGITYNRCVIDIDQSKVTPQEVSKFWAPLDITNPSLQSLPCAAALATLQTETDAYKSRISQIQGEVSDYNAKLSQLASSSNEFRRTMRIGNKNPRQVGADAEQCETRTKSLTNQLAGASNTYNTSINAINREIQSSYALIDTYTSNIDDFKKDITMINSQSSPVSSTVGANQRLSQKLNNQFTNLSQENDDCGKKLLQEMQTLTTRRGQEVDIRNQRDRLLQDRANAQEALAVLKSINTQLKADATATAERAKKAREQSNTCNRNLQSATKEAQDWVDELAKIKTALAACQSALAPYQSQVLLLTSKVEQLQKENPGLVSNIYDLQTRIQDAAYKFAQIKSNTDINNAQLASDACQRTTDLNMMSVQIQASLVPLNKPRERIYLLPPCQDVIRVCGCPK